MTHSLVALVTLLALVLFLWMTANVGRARGKFGVPAPATSGDPQFERIFRVQANTLEGLVIFLPALWLCALAMDHIWGGVIGDLIASALGAVWIIGRIIYMQAYERDPASRGVGFGIQALATLLLLVSALVHVIWSLFKP